jgi:hypothetical protein
MIRTGIILLKKVRLKGDSGSGFPNSKYLILEPVKKVKASFIKSTGIKEKMKPRPSKITNLNLESFRWLMK